MASYFTQADLLAIWQSAVDPLYAQPFLEAGDGGGLEAYTQGFAVMERVSQAIDRTMQAMFILPHSGQTSIPASGDKYAVATVELRREATFHLPIIFPAYQVAVEESAVDWGVDGPESVLTGRRYWISSTVVFESGQSGPITSAIEAQSPGYSWNNPIVGSINTFVQLGAGQYNARATVLNNVGFDTLYSANEYATFVPDSVGQYVIFTSGANDGNIRRITSYVGPSTVPVDHGGAVTLAQDLSMVVSAAAGYMTGEPVSDTTTGATGTLLHYNTVSGLAIVERKQGIFEEGNDLLGDTSGVATAISVIGTRGNCCAFRMPAVVPGAWIPGETLTDFITGGQGTFLRLEGGWAILNPIPGTAPIDPMHPYTGAVSGVTIALGARNPYPALIPESRTASWRILRWGADLGFSITNTVQPAGGALGILDEYGRERKIPRGTGESDNTYRRRLSKLPDVVSPNAIRRAIARFMTPHGWVGSFREVGTLDFPGFFYDIPISDAPDYAAAWDMDYTIRWQDRFRVWTDYTEFRAFFLVGVPRTGMGEFGIAYDSHPTGFYDIAPWPDFYDGTPTDAGAFNVGLWNDITTRKAGGVGFDFYQM